MAQFFDPASVSGFGAFAQGLTGGYERGQGIAARQYALQQAQENQQNYQQYKQAMQGVNDLSTTNSQVTGTNETGGPDVTATPTTDIASQAQLVKQRVDMLLDPTQRMAAASAFSSRMSSLLTPAIASAGQAMQQGDLEGATSSLNWVGKTIGIPGMSYVIKDGKIVNKAGEEVQPEHLLAMMMYAKQDPEGALKILADAKTSATEEEFKNRQIKVMEANAAETTRHYKALEDAANAELKARSPVYAAQAAEANARALYFLGGGAGAKAAARGLTSSATLEFNKAQQNLTPFISEWVDDKTLSQSMPDAVANYATQAYIGSYSEGKILTPQEANQIGSISWALVHKNDEGFDANEFSKWTAKHGVDLKRNGVGALALSFDGKTYPLPDTLGQEIMYFNPMPGSEKPPAGAEPPPAPAPAASPSAAINYPTTPPYGASGAGETGNAPIPNALREYDKWRAAGGFSAPPPAQPAMKVQPRPPYVKPTPRKRKALE